MQGDVIITLIMIKAYGRVTVRFRDQCIKLHVQVLLTWKASISFIEETYALLHRAFDISSI